MIFITVGVPNELDKYAAPLQQFVEGMVMKLYKNRHKETPTRASLREIMDLLVEEILEFEQQVEDDKFNENSLVELMDQANFSFLAYVALRLQGVEHDERTRLPTVGGEAVGHTEHDTKPVGG